MERSNSKLSIIIPCYNEEKYIGNLLNELLTEANPYEIIVIDDFSSDNSVNIIKNTQDKRIKLIQNEKNSGKGHSIVQGFKNAEGEIILVQDADPEYSPKDINFLLTPFFETDADFVIGTRFQTKYRRKIGYFYHTVFNKLITFLVNLKSNTNFTDIECGYKAFKKELLNDFQLNENRFGIEVELIRKISKLKKKMYEVPVSYEMRSYEMGKKIGLKDAISAFYCLLKY